jgi:membrane protein DedA with SNARE-associated domain
MQIPPDLLVTLTDYEWLIVFAGTFFGGESVILSAAYLAGTKTWPLSTVFVWAFLGTMVADAAWFLLGGPALNWLGKRPAFQKRYLQLQHGIQRLTGNRPFLTLLFFKFLYGTRILMILHMSVAKLPFWGFMLFNALGTLVWLAVMVAIGWLAGRGLVDLLPFVQGVEILVTGVIILLIFYKLLSKWIERKVLAKLKQ